MFRITLSIMMVAYAAAFVPSPRCSNIRTSKLYNEGGSMEEIEFRIYPDGRVTEVVRGVKGGNCEKITEAINKQLGSVVASQPTEEMFETEIVVDQTIQEKNSDGGWDGASSW